MADSQIHKYYCTRCERFTFGETLGALAAAVNYHANSLHPSDFTSWTAANIESSSQYSCGSGPLPQYLVVHGTTSKQEPKITDEDRAMLAAGHVKWD